MRAAASALESDRRVVAEALLSVGDISPPCVLPSMHNADVDIRADAIAGRPLVMVFTSRLAEPASIILARLQEASSIVGISGAQLFAVVRDARIDGPLPIAPAAVLIDRDGVVSRAFGADLAADQAVTIVVRPNQHVMAILTASPLEQGDEAVLCLQALAAARSPMLMASHPPVLMVPDVLSPDDCRHLMMVYEKRGLSFMPPGPGVDYIGTDYKMRIPEHGRGDRVDHWIVDRDTTTLLHARIERRLLPEIAKAFQYRITRWERLRIGCYQGARGGKTHGHRDNVDPTPYRRFAVSINLNVDEFEGGALRFPEFGDQRYRPPSGTAIVFSSSLLHEALEVTAGRRLVVLGFLFGDT